MARKNASAIFDDQLDTAPKEPPRAGCRFEDTPLDARLLDLDDEAESPFLRAQKRVPVRKGPLPRRALDRARMLLRLLLIAGLAGLIAVTLYRYLTQSWRFQLESSDNIATGGAHNVSRAQLLDVFGADIERNIFFVPLGERQKQVQEISWIESASVMRLLPNQLRVEVKERTPVAFVEINSHIELIDGQGVVLERAPGQQSGYSFPVIVGTTDSEPLSTRAARMKVYAQLVRELDSGGTQYSRDLSDVDLSDPDDVKATVADPHGAVLLHLGSSNFLDRFRTYVSHLQEWRTQFPALKSLDLRYQHQVIVNPDEVRGALPEVGAANAGSAAPAASNQPIKHTKSKKHH